MPSARGLGLEAWEQWMIDHDEPRFRARQIVSWLFEKRVDSFDAMSNLSQKLRSKLAEHFSLETLPIVRVTGSEDTTRKYLFRLVDGRLVETVLIPASVNFDGERSDRRTLCVSSQVGCAFGCKFCASGLDGFTRNLSADEIVSQVMEVEAHSGHRVSNIVFMGMGEPLANLRNLEVALQLINAEWGLGIGSRQITISTSGLAPQIERLARLPMQIRLAISLHGATDPVRSRIMPINDQFPIERLFEALAVWQQHKKQKVTFEYILIEDINDGLDEAAVLAKRARSLGAKVNLIPYNRVEGLEWKRPGTGRQEAFLKTLRKAGVTATLRREKGHDIDAACGQLRLQQERSERELTTEVNV
ncbi:MAG: 23S rRNA (adenine(2503)-C(2))-methyltransferase RlmN [Verrucomicrobiota bacterium]